jgi:hypothetical protein
MTDTIDFVQEKWVIMDKHRKIIARGAVRNRRLTMLHGHRKSRILTYTSKAKAEVAFKKYGFYKWEVEDYLIEQYGDNYRDKDYLEAVEVEVIMRISV